MIFRVLVWLAKPLPYGRAIFSYIPAVAAPWKGAQLEAEKAFDNLLGLDGPRKKREPDKKHSARVGLQSLRAQDVFIWFSLLSQEYLTHVN